jgi:predicted metal-dependent hydrolase
MITEPPTSLHVRSPELPFPADLPRHWFAGSALATHLANGVNLLFPSGERFFVRSVRHYQALIDADPKLAADVRAFFGQEGRHAQAHERFFAALEAQGYVIRPFLQVFERIAWTELEPRLPAELRLSVTVALEHYTAILAERALTLGDLDHAHPALRALLAWHAAEEIEHRAVAFDVLRKVNPSYALRMGGMALATLGLVAFWLAAVTMLLEQDGLLGGERLRRERHMLREGREGLGRGVFLRGLRAYARRDFHPNDRAIDGLARDYLTSAGLA